MECLTVSCYCARLGSGDNSSEHSVVSWSFFFPGALVFKLDIHENHLDPLLKHLGPTASFLFSTSDVGARLCISNKFLYIADAVGPGTTL